MKLKYLNPNVVFVVSGQSADAPAGSDEASLTVQLLDSVSGQILYRQTLEVWPSTAIIPSHLSSHHAVCTPCSDHPRK